MTDELGLIQNEKLVDIHGREISTTTVGKNGEDACLLSDLKQTGVAIFQKSHYAKLSAIKKEFGADFVEFMLDQAKSYMLANRISFTHQQIMDSIENAKRVLTCNEKPQIHVKKEFLKDRKIETGSGDEIHIKVSNFSSPTTLATPPKLKSPTPKLIATKPPRQLLTETDSSSDLDTKSTKKHLEKKFPKKGFSIQRNTQSSEHTNDKRQSQSSGQRNDKKQSSDDETPKLRPPKRFSYNVELKEHDVIVTRIDKRNCVWVRDLVNCGLFEQIHQKVNDEAKFQPVPAKPWELQKVYMAKDKDAWFRCKIVRFHPLTVFFLDYGNVAEVDEIKVVSEELAKTPCMAVRITFKEDQYNPVLEDEIRIKPFVQNGDGTFFVNVLTDKTNPAVPLADFPVSSKNCEDISSSMHVPVSSKNREDISSLTQNGDEDWNDDGESQDFSKEVEDVFLKKPDLLCSLLNEQRVAIVGEKDGEFFLRTKEGFDRLRSIDQAISEYVKNAKSVRNLKVNQLVLCESKKDNNVYRAVVNKVNEKDAEVEYLDYPQSVTVELASIKSINEWLSNEPITYFSGGKLLGFEEESLDENSKELIQEYIIKRQKFTVTLGFDDELDLMDGNRELLSEKLKKAEKKTEKISLNDVKTDGNRPRLLEKLKTIEKKPEKISLNDMKTDGNLPRLLKKLKTIEKKPEKILLKDMKTFTPEPGLKAYVCGSYRNSKHFSLVPSEELIQHVDYILRPEIEDKEPYTPITGEVCLCYYVDNWYRCVVARIFDTEYEVLLLDFGNTELMKKEALRKPDSDITKVPIVGLPCVLTDLPQHPNLEELLRKMLIDGELYKADVKKRSEGKWQVEIPSIYKRIRETQL